MPVILMNLSSPPLLPPHDHLSSPLSPFTTTPPQLSSHYPPHIHHLSPPVKHAPIPLKFSPSHVSSHTHPVHIVRDSTIVCSRHPAYQETSSSDPPPIQTEPIHQNEYIPPPHATVHTLPHIAHPSLNPLQKLMARGLDAIENTVIASLEKQHPLPSTTDPRIQLTGNFFPVPENAVQHELEVEGEIPSSLEGMYVRNGANPMFKPVAGHHLFDGDGMLHAVRFKQGIVSYANRFTRTHRLQEEEKLGRALFPKAVGELHGHSGLARLMLFYARSAFGLIDGSKGMGVANAGVVFFNGHLLAMSEDDLPYAVNITSAGDLSTIGRYNFNGQLASSMIAHPKVDAKTGELFVLSYDVLKKPYLKYFKFCADGNKCPEVTISVKEPTMMHDFAITENHVVIPDQQVVFRLQEMMSGGSPVVHAKEKMPRFGLLPRNAVDESAMVWVDVPDCFCFHLWNAWEEGDEVVVIASCMTPPDSIFNESSESLRSILSEIRLNKATKTSTRRALISSINLEAGQVNGNFLGRRSQFAYLAIAEPWPKCSGIAKVDLLKGSNHNSLHCVDGNDGPCTDGKDGPCMDGKEGQDDPCMDGEEGTCNIGYSQTWPQSDEHHVVTKFMYPSDCYGGEPMFVPRSSDPSAPEDDGYVLSFMHNEKTDKSELLILDASSPSLEMVARVKLPSRVPYGFHGTFITAEELEHQKVG